MSEESFELELGLVVTRRHADGVTCRLPLRGGLLNSEGTVHGGIIATVADEAAWHAIIHCLGERRKMTTAELKVNYLRPFVGRSLTARGTVLKLGRMLCVARVEMFNADRKLAAHATVTYAVLEPEAKGLGR